MVSDKEIYAWIERILEKENKHVEIQLQLVKTIRMLQDTVEKLEKQVDTKTKED